MANSPSYRAGTNIAIAVFVKLETGDHTITTCGAGDLAVGVSSRAPFEPVLPGGSVGYAIPDGETAHVHGLGENCEVMAGDTVTAGFGKSDAAGKVVQAATTEKYTCIIRAGALVSEFAQITLEHGVMP